MIRPATSVSIQPARIKSPELIAQDRWVGGAKAEVKTLHTTRGAPDLLKHPKDLEKYKVGEFRVGRGPLKTVYQVPVSGPNDKPQYRLIVRDPQVGADDRPTGKNKFYDLGTLASGPTI